MSDADRRTEDVAPTEEDVLRDEGAPPGFRDESGQVSRTYLDAVSEALEREEDATLATLAADLHEADLADLLEALEPGLRPNLILRLGRDFDFTVLTEVDDGVREQILDDLAPAQIALGLEDLDSDDAVRILEDLEKGDQESVLSQLSIGEQIRLRRGLDYPEESAGRLMQTEFVAVPSFWSVGQTIDYMREEDELPEFYELFVVDPAHKLVGAVPLNRFLQTRRSVSIGGLVDEARHMVSATTDREEVARLFERYNLLSMPVVDDTERMVGVIMVDDVLDVIQEEADEDIRRLSGIGDEEISDSVRQTVRSRVVWLVINLGTAVLASLVIGLFEATIEQMVALAVLMPIVASMGGNAATQTMTVAVRALAARDLGNLNARRIVKRETAVGLINGVVFAVLIGVVASVWFANVELGIVIGVAMVVNMLAAGLAGILIPLTLQKLKVDPAIASGVFVTTVTDVVGFFAFLGFAALWFGLG